MAAPAELEPPGDGAMDVSASSPADGDLLRVLLNLLAGNPAAAGEISDRVRRGLPLEVRGRTFTCGLLQRALEAHEAVGGGAAASSSSSGPAPAAASSSAEPGMDTGVAGLVVGPVRVGEDHSGGEPEESIVAQEGRENSAEQGDGRAKFRLLEHEGVLRIMWHPGKLRWELVHTLTGERLVLPESEFEWDLSFVDGFGFMFEVQEGAPQVLEADELLQCRVFKQVGGERFMAEVNDGQGDPRRMDLEQVLSNHSLGEVFINLGMGIAKDKVKIAMFQMPRDCCRFYWSIAAIVDIIGAAAGTSPAFIQKYIMAWDRALVTMGIAPCLRSQQYENQRAKAEDKSRVLRFITVNTVGFIAMLAKWAYLPTNRGGLKSMESVGKAKSLLEALVALAARGGGECMLYFGDIGQRGSFVDMPVGAKGFKVSFDEYFNMDLLEVAALPRPRRSELEVFFDLLKGMDLGKIQCLDMLDKVFRTCYDGKKSFAMGKQLVWLIGSRLEAVTDEDTGLVEICTDEAQMVDIENCNARYYQGCAEAAGGPLLHLSASCDKSRVHSMNLSNCAFALPDGRAWWAPPQDGDVAERELGKMRQDVQNFEKFSEKVEEVPGLAEVVERSAMKHFATKQIAEILQGTNYTVGPEVRDFLHKSHSRVLGSQVVEDGFNIQKNAAPTPWQNRRGTMTAAFNSLIVKRPLSEKHRYQEVAMASNPAARDMKVPERAFKAPLSEMPHEFSKLTSFKQKPDWPSCRAEDWTAAYCDQVLMKQACDEEAFDMVQYTWVGAVMKADHDVVVRRVANGVTGDWMIPLGQVANGVVIMWPVFERKVGRETYFLFRYAKYDEPELLYYAVWNLAEWQARRVVWRSPAWQAQRFTAAAQRGSLKPWGIKPFAVGPVESYMSAASECGFWRLGKPLLQRLAKHLGAGELQGEDDLFKTAERLAKHSTGKSDREIMGFMEKRLATEEGDTSTSINDFLALPDALMCVTRQEADELQRVAGGIASQEHNAEEFKAAYKRRQNIVRAAGKSKGRQKAAAAGSGRASGPLVLPAGDLTQPQLKPLLPPDSSIWIGNKTGCWQSQYRDFARVSRSWHLHGHRRAAVMVLRDCWSKYLLTQGMDETGCPIVGLFDEDAETRTLPPGAAVGSASSSS